MVALLLLSLTLPAHALGSRSGLFGGSSDFLPVDQALPFSHTIEDDRLVLSWDTAPEHYLYRERVAVTSLTEGVSVDDLQFSLAGETIDDPFFGESTVFYQPVDATVAVTLPARLSEARLEISYQGCANAGLCYPPQTRTVVYHAGTGSATGADGGTPGPAGGTTVPTDTRSATGLAGYLASQSATTIALLFLVLGLGLTFTPCVLPMVPIISALVSSKNTQSTAHAVLLAGSYVVGMALTYAAAGVLTGLLGAGFNLQAHLQSPIVLGVFAGLFGLFALAMFNVFDLQLPAFIRDRLNTASHTLTGGRVASVFGIGAISALVVSPCVSAPLAGSLLYISATQDAVIGGIALFALGLGMGIPLILVAVGGRKYLPSTGPWMNIVKSFYGVMLLAVAIWLLERLIPAWASLTLWGLLVAVTGVQLGAFDKASPGWARTWKGLGLVMFAYGLALLTGALGGADDPLKPLAPYTAKPGAADHAPAGEYAGFLRLASTQAINDQLRQAAVAGQPVMLDFYADWCISCKIMERRVFADPVVAQALSGHKLLQIDLTANTAEHQAMLNDFGLFGPPSILFFHGDGRENTEARVLGEMDKNTFLAHLDTAVGLTPRGE
ncbi:thiol:disulfide interchange protein [Marinobacter sp. X15-166B]|nr:thiol:disulfide interchange protein [Marinobacter sp. X15-166B]